EEWGYGIELDGAGNMYLAGFTWSEDFPVVNPLQGHMGDRDGFIAKLAPQGNALLYSTYLGGSGLDDFRYVQLDPAGNIHLAGYTTSPDFPLAGALMPRGGQ